MVVWWYGDGYGNVEIWWSLDLMCALLERTDASASHGRNIQIFE